MIKDDEGAVGDGIIALFDDPDRNLRLYAIKFGRGILILGNGGEKSKNIRAWQEYPQLTKAVSELQRISKTINDKIREREITFSSDGMSLMGDLQL